MKVDVEWLKDLVTMRPPAEDVADRLTMAGLEVKHVSHDHPGHTVFDIEITSNRPDWLSHIGVAREIAAVENSNLKLPEIDQEDSRKLPPGWKVSIKDNEACPYYTGVLIEGIEHNETPDVIKNRLRACGLRSINLIVDITNYVLMETGQPLHAFDADMIRDKEIQIRHARAGESLKAIDGTRLELQTEDLVIADSSNAVALAGIMGGLDSEVTSRTRNIFLESAYFQPSGVRRSSRRLSLASESSYRFERKVDPSGVDFARKRALFLIRQYAKPRFMSTVLKAGTLPGNTALKIHLSSADIKRVLGTDIKTHTVTSILGRLGLEVKPKLKDGWEVTVPTFRFDLKEPIDLIEEVARIYGYNEIPSTLPEMIPIPYDPQPLAKMEKKAADFLSSSGFFESVTFSLVSERGLPVDILTRTPSLVNPMHADLKWLRPTLITSLLNVVKTNYFHGAESIRFFEIANVYKKIENEKKPKETRTLTLVLSGAYREKNWLDASRAVSFYDAKGVLETLSEVIGIKNLSFRPRHDAFLANGSAAEVNDGEGRSFGIIGAINQALLKDWDIEQEVFCAEIDLSTAQGFVKEVHEYKSIAKYPSIKRDLSAVLPENIKAAEVVNEIKSLGGLLVTQVEIFDIFTGGRIPPGSKSISFRITYQASDRTLISEEIQDLHSIIGKAVVDKFQASFQ